MLKLENIHKTFHAGTVNQKIALDGLSLTLNDGDFVTVIGGNGAGKSTLLNTIAGTFPVDSGTITIDGEDITDLSEEKRARFLGRVFQDPMMGTAADMWIEENMALACDFMRQAQRGDYFQMSAKYEYGTGAHSAIMLGYDPETDEIHWMDSNMRGGKKKGIRYGLVQFDEVKSVEWWASTFCKKTRGATLYRLRDDIVYRPGHEPENTTSE